MKSVVTFVSLCSLLYAQQAIVTDGRIMELAQMGVSEAEMLRIVTTAPRVDFDLRPISTDAMMRVGVTENIIKAMAARESGSTPAIVGSAPAVTPASFTRDIAPSAHPVPSELVALASKDWVLHEGTPLRIRIMRTVTSSNSHEGDSVDFQTLDDIAVNGGLVIPKASTVIATVTIAQSKHSMGRGGKLAMNVDYVRLPTGEKLALRGVQDLKGGGHTGAMTGAMVATAIVFWPAAPFFLFMHGKDVVIPEGHEVTVYTNTDYKVPSSFQLSGR